MSEYGLRFNFLSCEAALTTAVSISGHIQTHRVSVEWNCPYMKKLKGEGKFPRTLIIIMSHTNFAFELV